VDALYHLGAASGKELGKYMDEIDLYNESLQLKKSFTYDDNHTESMAETLVCMIACYYILGDFRDLMTRYNEAMCVYNNWLEGNHSNVPKLLHSMGVLNCELGGFQESLDSYKESLSLNHEHGGKDSVNTSCWMGRINREKNTYNSASDYFSELVV